MGRGASSVGISHRAAHAGVFAAALLCLAGCGGTRRPPGRTMGHDSGHTTDDNVLAYNLFVSDAASAVGPNTHGSAPHGPVHRTRIYANTIVFTGANSQAIVCGCAGGATVQNNLLVAEWKAAYYAGQIAESHNLYWDLQRTSDSSADPLVQFAAGASASAIDSTSLRADPLLVDAAVPGGDHHLSAGSPGVDLGGPILTSDPALQTVVTEDLDLAPSPQGSSYDVGAYNTHPEPKMKHERGLMFQGGTRRREPAPARGWHQACILHDA